MLKIPLKQYWNLLVDYLLPQRQHVFLLAIALLSNIGLQILNPQILQYFIDTGQGFSIWRESRVALATAIKVKRKYPS